MPERTRLEQAFPNLRLTF